MGCIVSCIRSCCGSFSCIRSCCGRFSRCREARNTDDSNSTPAPPRPDTIPPGPPAGPLHPSSENSHRGSLPSPLPDIPLAPVSPSPRQNDPASIQMDTPHDPPNSLEGVTRNLQQPPASPLPSALPGTLDPSELETQEQGHGQPCPPLQQSAHSSQQSPPSGPPVSGEGAGETDSEQNDTSVDQTYNVSPRGQSPVDRSRPDSSDLLNHEDAPVSPHEQDLHLQSQPWAPLSPNTLLEQPIRGSAPASPEQPAPSTSSLQIESEVPVAIESLTPELQQPVQEHVLPNQHNLNNLDSEGVFPTPAPTTRLLEQNVPSQSTNSSSRPASSSPEPREIRIVVIGRTGSDISQFIHDVTQNYVEGVATSATGLRPFTKEIKAISSSLPDIGNVTLIDTPGFDYNRGNTEHDTFRKVAEWNEVHGNRLHLDDVIYMYNIWSQELLYPDGTKLLTSDDLERACGLDWRKKVMLVTSHWNKGVQDDGEARETQLRGGYWSYMMERGSSVQRYEKPGERDKALDIIRNLLVQAH